MTSLHQRLIHVLDALGPSTDAVADTLLAGGWTGLREDGLNCPISNYVTAVMPDVEVAAVASKRITVISTRGETIDSALPAAAARFVVAFDSGAYDELAATITRSDGEVIDDLER